MNKPELLAPAGNWDCVRAAVANGADAVYFGLDRFNARMRADNFSLDDLGSLMPFLHGHGVRGYVTLNVLIFPDEMQAAAEYIHALERARVDAVIVQDTGLAAYVAQQRREGNIRHLELHLSTQMTLTCPEAVQLVDELFDPQQIVLARELSLREIEACAKATRKPIEVFCHGALCVAYSGQCLTSESLGQRSANRGECAQACRMPYRLEVDGRMRDLGERRYLFSPQDLCTLDRIPQMLAAGVHSFKVEGRLKSPEYVAATTRAYRRAVDAVAAGTFGPELVAELTEAVKTVFHREFSVGMYYGRPGADQFTDSEDSLATTVKRHVGIVIDYFLKAGIVQVKVQDHPIRLGDRLQIHGPTTGVEELTVDGLRRDDEVLSVAERGNWVTFRAPRCRVGDKVFFVESRPCQAGY